jgi:hypothetical protein
MAVELGNAKHRREDREGSVREVRMIAQPEMQLGDLGPCQRRYPQLA